MCEVVQKCCRICLDVETHHVSILGDPTISLYLKSCLSVTISATDHLPKTICVSCVSSLNEFYNFQLNARCSQDWLESQDKVKKSSEIKMPLQPLPDSEYNSDSLLEFLNNTANIEDYLNNLGKEDIPCIVSMLDKNEHSIDTGRINTKSVKVLSPKKKDLSKKFKMDIDMPSIDFRIVKDFIKKDMEPKNKINTTNKSSYTCYGCKVNYDSIPKLLQHMSMCDSACRTCIHCNMLFDSKQQMQQHSIVHHPSLPLSCNCGETFSTKEKLKHHHRTCHLDYAAVVGCGYRCKQCGDTFKERFQLYKHAKEHVMKAEQRVCDICGHTFTGSDALKNHWKDVHDRPENALYRCKICGKTSADHKEMYSHVKNHTSSPEPVRHLCESCGRSFATHATLLRHTTTHINTRTRCSLCDRTFTDTRVLTKHMLDHKQMVMCEKCGQSVNRYKLERHSCV